MLSEWINERRLEKLNKYLISNPDIKMKIIMDGNTAYLALGDVNESETRYPLDKHSFNNIGLFWKGYVNEIDVNDNAKDGKIEFTDDDGRVWECDRPDISEEIDLSDSILEELNFAPTDTYEQHVKNNIVEQAMTPVDPSSLDGNMGLPSWAIYTIVGSLIIMAFGVVWLAATGDSSSTAMLMGGFL